MYDTVMEESTRLPSCSQCDNPFKEGDRAVVAADEGLLHTSCLRRIHRQRDSGFWASLSHVLAYEISEYRRGMFRAFHPLLNQDLDHNTRIEALLIHIRNLYDFMFRGSLADSTRDLVAEEKTIVCRRKRIRLLWGAFGHWKLVTIRNLE